MITLKLKAEKFPPYITNVSTNVGYKDILLGDRSKPRDKITKEQAMEDIEMLEYLLEGGYAGKDYVESKGFSFATLFQVLRDYINQNTSQIDVKSFENRLGSNMQGINDSHLVISGHKTHRFIRRTEAYFSDILLRQVNRDRYEVIDSLHSAVPIGSILEHLSRTNLFRTLSPRKEKHYLLGIMASESVSHMSIKLKDNIVNVPLHRCRLHAIKNNQGVNLEIIEKESIPIVKSNSFRENTDLIAELDAIGRRYRGRKLILDISINGGGSDRAPAAFLQAYSGRNISSKVSVSADLLSPVILQALEKNILPANVSEELVKYRAKQIKKLAQYRDTHVKNWEINRDYYLDLIGAFRKKFMNKDKQNSPLVVLATRRTASSAESAISYARSMHNSIVVGENSSGCRTFGNIFTYSLPHSLIKIQLASSLTIEQGFEEGLGFTPDYWLDSSEPVKEIVAWLNNSEKYCFRLPRP